MTYSRQQRSELAGSPLAIDYDTHTLRYGKTNRGSLMAEHNYRRSQARAVCQRDLERGQLTELRQRLGEPEVCDFAGRQDDGNNVRVVTHAVECPTCYGVWNSGLAVYRICLDSGIRRMWLNRVQSPAMVSGSKVSVANASQMIWTWGSPYGQQS